MRPAIQCLTINRIRWRNSGNSGEPHLDVGETPTSFTATAFIIFSAERENGGPISRTAV
jgi:hypothetical protein